MPASYSSASFDPNDIIAGDPDDLIARSVTLISGQNLSRGAVLGKITTGGKYTLSLSASADGSQTPDAILAESCDASGGDKTAIVYTTGFFNAQRLTIGTAHTVASITEGLRVKGIHLINSIGV